jgi:hypothetical protein
MAQDTHAVNLSADNWPLLASLQGQTVIIGKTDMDYELEINTTNKLAKERKIPQAYFMHNCMPTGQGYQSVGYNIKLLPPGTGAMNFDKALMLRDSNENKFLFSPAQGVNWVYDGINQSWKSITPFSSPNNNVVTVAYLNGTTYIFWANTGCFTYDHPTQTFIPVPLTGLTPGTIKGITTSQNFLIAWDNFTVYRAQLNSPTVFTPDFTLGSGSDQPQDKKGIIVDCLAISNGYMIYTTKNVVGATANVNQNAPFIFKEVADSAGINDIEQVAYLDTLGIHYAWTQSGFMQLNKAQAAPLWPEFTDFITSNIFEEFDTDTWSFDQTFIQQQLAVKVAVIANRYVVISYGLNTLSYALVFDLTYKRWGKLKIDHVACFDFFTPTIQNASSLLAWTDLGNLSWQDLGATSWNDLANVVNTQELAKQTFGFLQADGTVLVVDFGYTRTDDDAILVLGKYQYSRNRFLVIDEIQVQNVNPGAEIDVRVLTSIDGQTISQVVTPYQNLDAPYTKNYQLSSEGKNHAIVFHGSFHFTSIEVTYHLGGRL